MQADEPLSIAQVRQAQRVLSMTTPTPWLARVEEGLAKHRKNACIEMPAAVFVRAVELAALPRDQDREAQHPAIQELVSWWNDHAPNAERRVAHGFQAWVVVAIPEEIEDKRTAAQLAENAKEWAERGEEDAFVLPVNPGLYEPVVGDVVYEQIYCETPWESIDSPFDASARARVGDHLFIEFARAGRPSDHVAGRHGNGEIVIHDVAGNRLCSQFQVPSYVWQTQANIEAGYMLAGLEDFADTYPQTWAYLQAEAAAGR